MFFVRLVISIGALFCFSAKACPGELVGSERTSKNSSQSRFWGHHAIEVSKPSTLDSFPGELENLFSNVSLSICGAGDLYLGWTSLRYRMNFLTADGCRRTVYDPRLIPKPNSNWCDNRLGNDQVVSTLSRFPKESFAFVLSQPKHHLANVKEILQRTKIHAIYLEKPMVVSMKQLGELLRLIKEYKTVSFYLADHFLFASLPLFAALGIQTPYQNLLVIQSDTNQNLRTRLSKQQSLLGTIEKIEIHYTEEQGPQKTRKWLLDSKQGGGALLDLAVHALNVLHVANLPLTSINHIAAQAWDERSNRLITFQESPKPVAESLVHFDGIVAGKIPLKATIGWHGKERKNLIRLVDSDQSSIELDLNDQTLCWKDSSNKTIGILTLPVDPYLLTLHHAISFFQTKSRKSLFLAEQQHSLRQLLRMKNQLFSSR